jgi:ATP-binding cassette subfamily C protein
LINRTLGSYLRQLVGVARWKLALSLVLMVMFSLTEGVGIVLLLPTLEVAGLRLDNQGQAGRYAQIVSGLFAAAGLHPDLLMLLGLFVMLIGARTFLGQAQALSLYSVQQDFELHLRRRLYRAVSDASWLYISRIRASDLTHALTAELQRVGVGTYALQLIISDLAVSSIYLLIAFKLSAPMTGLVLACCAVLAIVFRGRIHAIRASGIEISASTKSLYAGTIEHLHSLKTAKAYGAERRNFEIFSTLSRQVARSDLEGARAMAAASTWHQLGYVTILAIVLYSAIRILAVPPAAILILLLMFARVMPRFMSCQEHYRRFVSAMPSFANVIALENNCIAAADMPADGAAPLEFSGEVRFDGVSFTYGRSDEPAVSTLDIAIPAGKIIALVGPSGAGKSTIADLLMGLLEPQSGVITVDGVSLTARQARAWRTIIGYVASDAFLFHDTIRANLLWARPGASETEVLEALEKASACDFVRGLPAGLETVVGDRGVLVSQGERQRLALARAFLRRPSLLILDEATNNLDSENERRVLDALEQMHGSLTVVLIAHRLSTVRRADLIYVIEGGTAVESGDWVSLTERNNGRFRALREAQAF